MSQPAISKHLKVLERAGRVSTERQNDHDAAHGVSVKGSA
jgi:DNA-binding transcriptional ArsR family regulator